MFYVAINYVSQISISFAIMSSCCSYNRFANSIPFLLPLVKIAPKQQWNQVNARLSDADFQSMHFLHIIFFLTLCTQLPFGFVPSFIKSLVIDNFQGNKLCVLFILFYFTPHKKERKEKISTVLLLQKRKKIWVFIPHKKVNKI